MNVGTRLLMAAVLGAALMSPTLAEERQTDSAVGQQKTGETDTTQSQPAAPTITMRDLLNAGYEVRTTTFIPHDAVKRAGSTVDVDAMMFLLSKGAAVATCYTDLQSYTNGSFVTLACNEYK